MGFMIFMGAAVAVVGGVLGLVAWRGRTHPGETKYVLLATAGGEAEAHIWEGKLRTAGIGSHRRQVGDLLTGDLTTAGGLGPWGYQYEVWVRGRDYERARKALGL